MINSTRSRKLFPALGALVLAGVSLAASAHAVSFLVGPIDVVRSNTAGTTFATLTSSAATFCMLSSVQFENTDEDGEFARCRVTRGASNWSLTATLNENNDADIACSAICYNN